MWSGEGCLVGDGDHGCQFWPQSGVRFAPNETNQIVQITFQYILARRVLLSQCHLNQRRVTSRLVRPAFHLSPSASLRQFAANPPYRHRFATGLGVTYLSHRAFLGQLVTPLPVGTNQRVAKSRVSSRSQPSQIRAVCTPLRYQ